MSSTEMTGRERSCTAHPPPSPSQMWRNPLSSCSRPLPSRRPQPTLWGTVFPFFIPAFSISLFFVIPIFYFYLFFSSIQFLISKFWCDLSGLQFYDFWPSISFWRWLTKCNSEIYNFVLFLNYKFFFFSSNGSYFASWCDNNWCWNVFLVTKFFQIDPSLVYAFNLYYFGGFV